MAIYGIGVDTVNLERIDALWQEKAELFAKRILSDIEMKELETKSNPANYIAKCFAVKEAFAKALGTGFRDDVFLTHISYVKSDNGKPSVLLSGSTKAYADKVGAASIHLSVSDDAPNAVAFVVIES